MNETDHKKRKKSENANNNWKRNKKILKNILIFMRFVNAKEGE